MTDKHELREKALAVLRRIQAWLGILWERMKVLWSRIWAQTKVLWGKLCGWMRVLWGKIMHLWKIISDKYLAQQEVIKKQSEISRERITIKGAVLTFMETWGLGSRNIFYTMWHLLWRPGYLICDYINGHRRHYMQPFFMFFVLTLILVELAFVLDVQTPKNKDMTLIAYELIRDHKDWFTPEQTANIFKTAQWLDAVHDWRDQNRAWDILIQSLGVIFATWLLWRKSPRIGNAEWVVANGEYIEGYNFAEIVTVIAYILCQLQILSMIAMLLFHRLPFDHMSGWTMVLPKLVLFAVLLIDFKQLFQRTWGATAWRTLIIVLFV